MVTGADDKQDGGRVFASMVDQSQGLATTGYSFAGDGGGTFDYPTDPDDVSLDPNDNNFELNEIT